jgi:hypothetical protein
MHRFHGSELMSSPIGSTENTMARYLLLKHYRGGLAALAELDPALPRHTAVAAYLPERDGDPVTAPRRDADAARLKRSSKTLAGVAASLGEAVMFSPGQPWANLGP